MNNKVIAFLKLNGFDRMETNSYANDRCNVVYEDGYFAVADRDGNTTYSKDQNIYWLIGFLTYYGFMNKNYHQNQQQ
jgi:hypothetical protein